MGKYCFNSKGDDQVQTQMDLANKIVLERIRGVRSIILYGGFGRGEGSGRFIDGKFFPANDYDVYVITDKRIDNGYIEEVARLVAAKWNKKGITLEIFDKKQTLGDNFYYDFKCLTVDQLKTLFPMLRYYELKNSSVVVWGEDLRYLIPDYKVKDIPIAEAARVLLNRMTHLVEYMSLDGKHDPEMLKYFVAKAYIDACTALLILSEKYAPTYFKRMQIFKETYKKDFSELYSLIPHLVDRVVEATTWKLDLDRDINLSDLEYWHQARKDMYEIAKYFFSKFTGKEIREINDLSNVILNMRKEYYEQYGYWFLKLRGIDNKLIPKVMRFSLPYYFKYKYFLRVKEQINKDYYKIFYSSSGPDLVIFSALPYILFSLKEEGVDKEMFMEGRMILSSIYPVKGNDWASISQDYANAYVAFFLQKIV